MKTNFLRLFATLIISAFALSPTFAGHYDYHFASLKDPIDPAFRMISFTYPQIRTTHGMQVSTGPGTEYNYDYPWCWRMTWNDESYISILVNFNKEEIQKDWYLNIKQLSSIAGHNYSPIAIDLNGITIADHFDPLRDAWRIDNFKLAAENLKEGQNVITIGLQDAYTHYWIESVTISPEKPVKIWLLELRENH
jgi:hypothetical protein